MMNNDQGIITVDASDLINKLNGLAKPETAQALGEFISAETRMIWRQAVSGKVLPGMAHAVHDKEYAAALDDPQVVTQLGSGNVEFDVSRVYEHAGQLEDGLAPFDMKPAFLNSSKTKRGASGNRYLDIPFRHGARKSKASTRPKRSFATSMPNRIYELAKKLSESDSRFQSPDEPTTKPAVGGMSGDYTHTADIYEDMTKGKDTRSKNRAVPYNGAYLTWRRVSENSDRDSWWHPGIPAVAITQSVSDEVERRLPDMFEQFLKSTGLS